MFPEIRLKEASVLGFKRGVVPFQQLAQDSGQAIETVCVRDLREARESFFAAG
jgi:predicted ATP-dependent serine protease